eukprot:scaffold10945_cov62-Phaeocystis_antarctica.AAC.5
MPYGTHAHGTVVEDARAALARAAVDKHRSPASTNPAAAAAAASAGQASGRACRRHGASMACAWHVRGVCVACALRA